MAPLLRFSTYGSVFKYAIVKRHDELVSLQEAADSTISLDSSFQ